ncbi:hypothetical protein, partial [Klebsiella pneumoniae]|uniref:hypothetical protein n=1 Tax=Klebsiella pneumoniae TaxID=573 RepID=UPI002731E1AD
LMQNLKKLTEDGRIVVVTTHIMTSLDLLDRVCVLAAGRLAYMGPPAGMKAFFGVEDYVQIYGRLQEGAAREWAEKFQ